MIQFFRSPASKAIAGGESGLGVNQTPPVARAVELNGAALGQRRRKVRIVRFVAAETLVLGILVASIVAGVSARFSMESLTPIFKIVPIIAAATAAILPILFFGSPKRR